MRRFLIALLLCSNLAAYADIVVKDDTGTELHFKQPVKRIIALAPHIPEVLISAGAGARLVGTVQYSDYPDMVKKIPRVGGYDSLDMEAILALKPDLVIGWQTGNPPAQIDKIRALGIPLYLTQPNRLEDVAHDLERYGQMIAEPQGARAAAAFRTRLSALRAQYSTRPTLKVFYQVWNAPLMTIGGKQIISDVIRLCGGKNVFDYLEPMSPSITVEAVLSTQPE